ncbi:TrmH family RNA methyltransferase [Natranaerobius thermophilus]|uniref:tRNA/rRNA methyltransferase (SpoU) n=2 Tax=Natranaerobius TaxID=375928 RepID=B2A5N7_NATTJ|nr:tRNA/rRNA methyltransferase (SpoU) [Natranaerobius thermophilus JW/NM-WN-LF]
MITGENNSLIKKYRKLKSKKWRQEYQLVPLEGSLLIKEALHSGVKFDFVLYSADQEVINANEDLLLEIHNQQIPAYSVDPSLFQKTAFTETPQGILAVCTFNEGDLESLTSEKKDILILYQVQDPGNMGTLIRSADAFGFQGVVCSKGCVDPTNDKVVRSSMGSLFHIPVVMNSEIDQLFQVLQREQYFILFGDKSGSKPIMTIDLSNTAVALFVGNESRGLQDLNFDQKFNQVRHQKVEIPMFGKAESLNAGIAGSIMMYELSKKRFY